MEKGGKLRVVHTALSDEKTRFLEDIFTTCVDMRWRYISLGTLRKRERKKPPTTALLKN